MRNPAGRSCAGLPRSVVYTFALAMVGLSGACASRQTSASPPVAPPPAPAPPAAGTEPAPLVATPPAPVADSAPSAADVLIVDHAWIADATGPKARASKKNAAQRKSMDELRA